MVDFSHREEAPRDLHVIRLRPNVFKIDANAGVSGDGDESKTARVREIELEPLAEFGADVGLTEFVVYITYSAGLDL